MSSRSDIEIAIIGAGVVGLCCALFLQRAGAEVTIIDDGTPEGRASFGHAGVFGVPYCLPAATPAGLRALPDMIRDRNHPFVLRLRSVPQLLPWFVQFVRASRPAAVSRNTDAAAAIQRRTRQDWDELLDAAGARHLVKWSGMLEVCESAATLAAMQAAWQTVREHGFQVRELSAAEVRAAEPALATGIAGGAVLAEVGHTIDPHQLIETLQARFIADGGKIIRDRVGSIFPESHEGCQLVGRRAAYSARQVVIAAGAASAKLSAAFGNRVAIAAERGYHVMFAEATIELRRPVTLVDRKVVMSSLATGLRMTSMSEFTAPGARANHGRAARLFEPAMPLLPGLKKQISSRWVGSRPSTPDSLPVIGRSPVHPSVFFAFGHGSRGFTVAATTGRIIAALLQAKEPAVEIAPFRPDRFLRH